MRRSICYCEPNIALAGETNNWNFIYTAATELPQGCKLKFDLESKGRDIDWCAPTSNLKKNKNLIYGRLPNGKILQAKEVDNPQSIMPQFEFILPQAIPAGELFTIILGAPKDASPEEQGNTAQTNAQRRRAFSLYVDTSGKGRYDEPEIFTMDVRGNELQNINVLAPSYVTRNKRFDVIVRFEDEYGNLTSEAPPETLIELSYEHLRENLNWKLFVPETGFITLPNLYFNETGVYTITLKNLHTKETFTSPPIKCFADNSKNLFWGLLHGESERIDSTENIESCLRYFRDDKAMNFYAASPFESQEETSNDMWKWITQYISEFDEADRFAAFVGFQWQGETPSEGVRQILYGKDHKQILRYKDVKYNTLDKIYKHFAPKEMIAIPCFTMAQKGGYNFKNFNPEFERVVEIYNAWGSSECTKKAQNPRPIATTSKRGTGELAEGTIQEAPKRGCRFGFVAGGLDDRGSYSELFDSDQEQYSPGLTAIISTEHSRQALLEALYNRSCYATTGKRIILGFNLASFGIGSETSTALKHGLLINRHLSGFAAGTAPLQKVEIIRNGVVIASFTPSGYSLDFMYDDMDPLEKIAIDAKDKKPPFAYYYLRVTQVDGHMAWSSPIWVDYVPSSSKGKSMVKLRPPKATKAPVIFNDEDDDFSDDDIEDVSFSSDKDE